MRSTPFIVLVALLVSVSLGDTGMNPKVVERGAFTVVGIAARTSNPREMSADGIIGKQWGRLMQEGLLAKIPNKADSNIVAVYTDYASDHNGEYTYVLGARVKSDADVPAGMVAEKNSGRKMCRVHLGKGSGRESCAGDLGEDQFPRSRRRSRVSRGLRNLR